MSFAASEVWMQKLLRKIQIENLHYVFHIGDHTTAQCHMLLPIAAENFRWMSSFKWKSGSIFQGRKAKLSEFRFTELFLDDAVERRNHSNTLVTRMHSGSQERLIKQNRRNITACAEERFQRFDLLRFQCFLFLLESERQTFLQDVKSISKIRQL